jgi:hypothetical protein
MAYTVTKVNQCVQGDVVAIAYDIVADAATATLDTGLGNVLYHQLSPVSLSTAAIKLYSNKGASGTQIAGKVGISGCVSGDRFYLTVFGL